MRGTRFRTRLSPVKHRAPRSGYLLWLALGLPGCFWSHPAAGQTIVLRSELVQARAALRAGQPDTAVALSRRALDRDPADGAARLLLGLSLEAQGRKEEAVAVLAALQPLPAGSDLSDLSRGMTTALERLLPGALPAKLAPELLAPLPGARPQAKVGSVTYRVIAPAGTLPGPAIDPKYGWKFTYRAAVYIGPARRYSLYYQNPDDRELAASVADLLGRLHGAAASLIKRSPEAPEVRVWLPRSGRAGGEQYRDSIYLYAVHVRRSDGEWVREVAHEMGHLVLPTFAEYDAPEPMENGYLGERLLPKWLLDLGERTVWHGRVSLREYVRERALPVRRRFLEAGPGSPLRTDRSAAGMEYAIGLILALEAQHGPEFMARVFARNLASGMESLLLAYREEISTLRQFQIPVELAVPARSRTGPVAGGRLRFRRVTYRAYLPSGRWTVTVRGERLTGLKASVNSEPMKPASHGSRETRFQVTTGVSRWHLIQLESTAPGAALGEIRIAATAATVSTSGTTGYFFRRSERRGSRTWDSRQDGTTWRHLLTDGPGRSFCHCRRASLRPLWAISEGRSAR